MERIAPLLILLLAAACAPVEQIEDTSYQLWYEAPATDWMTEALPVGNGYMGVMFFGEPDKEQLQFSEESLWAGGPGSSPLYNYGLKEGAYKYLPKVRQLLMEGEFDAAHELARKELSGTVHEVPGYLSDYGAQQTMGDIYVSVANKGEVSDYRRWIDLKTGAGYISYQSGGTEHKRRFFGVYPNRVMVYSFSNNNKEGLDYLVTIETPHKIDDLSYKDSIIFLKGHLSDNMLGFGSSVYVKTDGEIAFDNGKLEVSGARSLSLIHSSATEYAPVFPHYRGKDYQAELGTIMAEVSALDAADLWDIHLLDYQPLFDRVKLNLHGNKNDSLNTAKRLLAYAGGAEDLGLEELYFQYARYLTLMSSRPGTMPMHLQGKWNNQTDPPWTCDYHTNINLQMLYWPAEVLNLPESHKPLIDYMKTLVEPGRLAAKEFFGARGWIVNTMNNAYGFTSPGWDFPWGFFPAGAAWLCQHAWEHFEYNQDTTYLREDAFPLMNEAALFWMDYLVKDDKGYLVSMPSYSPEHGGISKGASMDHQIVWDLFNNCAKAAEVLEMSDLALLFASYRDSLALPSIGSWGQLMEWSEDHDDPESKHRHVSHLFALHPGRQISLNNTPELAEAARVSLEARGDDGTGWSLAWKINFHARLQNGNQAYKLLRRLLQPVGVGGSGAGGEGGGGSYSNLLCAHPPFQLDGNMGAAAGIAAMLIQSQSGTIHLLPALPDSWSNGEVSGLKAQGGFELSFAWRQSRVLEVDISGTPGAKGVMQVGERLYNFQIPENGTYKRLLP
ncbi:MAG TPA: alpha-L-fucosidase [Marinilabiliaceae bacterium]|nr:alpha-L-fucosidase [Marinilabiliaceae bacterium]